MRGERTLLDSVIVIDHLNGVSQATEFIRSLGDAAFVSVITRAEVLTGLGPRDVPLGKDLLDRFGLVAIDRAVADLAAELRRRHRWRLPDAFQAAAARQHGLVLATRNVKDFPPRRFDFVRVPYAL